MATVLPGNSTKLLEEHPTERSRQEQPTRLAVNPLRVRNPRSNPSEMSNRDRSIENILMSLHVKKREAAKRLPNKLIAPSHSIKLPSIFRNNPQETRYNLSEELDQFEDRLSHRRIKPFSQLSREQSVLLQDCEGYRRLKQLRNDPRYPHNLSDSHCA